MNYTDNNKKRKWIIILWSLVLALVAISLSFNKSIWLDEALSLRWISMPWAEMMDHLIADVHPPLFYIVLKLFSFASPGSIALGKACAILSYVLTMLLGGLFLQKYFSTSSAFFFTLFTTSIPMTLVKTVEIRMYTMTMLFMVVTSIFVYRIVLNSCSNINWIGFIIFGLATAYTHYYGLLSMAFFYPALLLYLVIEKDWKAVKKWFIYSAITIVVYLPWLPIAIRQVTAVNNDYWIDSQRPVSYMKDLFRYDFFPHSTKVYCGVIALSGLFLLVQFVRKKEAVYYWGLACMIPFIAVFTFAYVYGVIMRPIMVVRYLLPALTLLIFGISVMCKDISNWITSVVCIFFIVMICFNYPLAYENEYDTNTDKTMTFWEENIEEDAKVYLTEGALHAVILYSFPNTVLGSFEELLKMKSLPDEFWILDVHDEVSSNKVKFAGYEMDCYKNMGLDNVDFTIYHFWAK